MYTEERKHVRFDFSQSEEEDGKEREDPPGSALGTFSGEFPVPELIRPGPAMLVLSASDPKEVYT